LLRYYIRLDDAHDKMNLDNWIKIINLLNKYKISSIIGVIPDNKDFNIMFGNKIKNFWGIIKEWQDVGHIIAIHGLNHLILTKEAGLVPKNNRSEFAGLSLEEQYKKLQKSIKIFEKNKIFTDIFIPPFHSFDLNTLKALKKLNINILYEGVSFYPYKEYDIYFMPQQYNFFKKRQMGVWSVCLHPNEMEDKDFANLEIFIQNNIQYFKNDFYEVLFNFTKKRNLLDKLFFYQYFFKRKLYLMKQNLKGIKFDKN